MEPSRQQAVRSDQNGWGCDSARSASFNPYYEPFSLRSNRKQDATVQKLAATSDAEGRLEILF